MELGLKYEKKLPNNLINPIPPMSSVLRGGLAVLARLEVLCEGLFGSVMPRAKGGGGGGKKSLFGLVIGKTNKWLYV